MSYQQTTFIVNELIAEPLSDALMAHGALSAAIEDAYAGTNEEQAIFGEPGIESEQIWHNSKILALFDEKADVAAIVAAAAEAVEIPPPAHQIELLPEQDWVRLTQAQFDPIKICLQWLDNTLKGGESVLDYGCGSGILTIAALKLGAASAVGVDIDPQAIAAGTDNAVQNRVETKFYLPDELPNGQFDVVVANILANPLRMLGEMLAARTKTGGRIVLSGLLEEQADELGGIYGQWFDLEPAIFDEGWACLSGVKR